MLSDDMRIWGIYRLCVMKTVDTNIMMMMMGYLFGVPILKMHVKYGFSHEQITKDATFFIRTVY